MEEIKETPIVEDKTDKELKEAPVKKTRKKYKNKKCKVIGKIKNGIIINFDGYCISFTTDIKDNEVEVQYIGEIGNKDFEIKLK